MELSLWTHALQRPGSGFPSDPDLYSNICIQTIAQGLGILRVWQVIG